MGRIVISVTDRLESEPSVDILFASEERRLVDSGSHTELVCRRAAYARLWEKSAGAGNDTTKANRLLAGAGSLEAGGIRT